MRIWKQDISLAALQATGANTAVSHLGIEFIEVGDDYLVARVPVNRQTCQPYGLLHGGVSVVLAETLGSCGAAFSVPQGTRVVGLEVNANHLRGVQEGWVTATARPVHLGRTTQVWQIELRDEQARLSCTSRLTMAVLAPDRPAS
ncbi:MAG: hypothetical protein RLZZ180_1995 [Pseudomonadota bacterium]|jgi:uncharacterized protein (TIGR00369 family)